MPSPTTVFYHADCLDGFGAAYAAWRFFGDGATYRPIHHGQAWREDEVADRDVFILDFSFPPADLLAMAGSARSVCLLDHHATARQAWAGRFPAGGRAGPILHRHPVLPLSLTFDLEKSGARLAWEHFHPGAPLPLALAHIEDQDMWRFRLEGTRAFCRALRLEAFEFATWDRIVRTADSPDAAAYRDMQAQGAAIERFVALEVERLGNGSLVMPVTLRGEPVDPLQALRHGLPVIAGENGSWRAVTGLAVNASALFVSDLGNRLAQRSGSFGLVWHLAGNGEIKASLRACGGADVALMAENYGGGGHVNASGFRLPVERFMAEVLRTVPQLP